MIDAEKFKESLTKALATIEKVQKYAESTDYKYGSPYNWIIPAVGFGGHRDPCEEYIKEMRELGLLDKSVV